MAKSAKRAKKAGGRSATSARGTRKTTKRSAKKSAKSAKGAKSARRSVRAASARRTGSTRSVKATRSAAGALKTKTSRTGAAKRAGRKSARKPNAAFMAPVTPSPALAEIVGDRPIPRTEVTKRLWAYIKKHDLQDAKNRRTIRADAALKPIFGGKASVNMFEMTRLVGQHLA
jgi:upstream activation factor subunit UAF30